MGHHAFLEWAITEQLLADPLDPYLRATTLLNSMLLLVTLDQLDQARSNGKEALDLFRGLEVREPAGIASSNLGYVELLRGGLEEAEGHFRDALEVSVEFGSPRATASSILGLAATRADGGSAPDAGRLLGAAQQAFDTLGVTYDTLEQAAHELVVAKLRKNLGEDKFAKAYAEGRTLAVEEAIALAEESRT